MTMKGFQYIHNFVAFADKTHFFKGTAIPMFETRLCYSSVCNYESTLLFDTH